LGFGYYWANSQITKNGLVITKPFFLLPPTVLRKGWGHY
jgi:hypothetical protein